MASCIFDAIECQKNETVLMIIVADFFYLVMYTNILLLMTCSFLTLTHFPRLTHANHNLGSQKGFSRPLDTEKHVVFG